MKRVSCVVLGGLLCVACGDDDERCLGATLCGEACVDTDTDPQNCGDCGSHCDATEICDGGECFLRCEGDAMACDGACVDTDVSDQHCGGCDQSCDATEICEGGNCVFDSCLGTDRWCEVQGACIPTDECCDDLDCTGGQQCDAAAGDCACPANGVWCGAAGACIDASSCCTSADCTAPRLCSGPGGDCDCPQSAACAAGEVGTERCDNDEEQICEDHSGCYLWTTQATCNHLCGLTRCRLAVLIHQGFVSCSGDGDADWDTGSGATILPDPYLTVDGHSTPVLTDTCPSLSFYGNPTELATFDPSDGPVMIRLMDQDLDADDLVCEDALPEVPGAYSLTELKTSGSTSLLCNVPYELVR